MTIRGAAVEEVREILGLKDIGFTIAETRALLAAELGIDTSPNSSKLR